MRRGVVALGAALGAGCGDGTEGSGEGDAAGGGSSGGVAGSSGGTQRWDAVYQMNRLRLATAPGDVFGGTQSLEMSVPRQDAELSNATDELLSPERDSLHLRYSSKFDAPFDVVGSSHNGAMIAAWLDGALVADFGPKAAP